jgi:hypothetical protein
LDAATALDASYDFPFGKLPESIVYDLCYNWLSVMDVSALDRALCSQTEREILFPIISNKSKQLKQPLLQCSSKITFCDSYWSWLVERNIFVETMRFNDAEMFDNLITKERNSTEKEILNCVEELKICMTSPLFEFERLLQSYKRMSTFFSNLKILYLECYINDDGLSTILETNKNTLTKIGLANCPLITGENLSLSSISNLTDLSITECKIFLEWNKIMELFELNKNFIKVELEPHKSFLKIDMLQTIVTNCKKLDTLKVVLGDLLIEELDDIKGILFPKTLKNLILYFKNEHEIGELQLQAILSNNNLPNTMEYLELRSVDEESDEEDMNRICNNLSIKLPRSLKTIDFGCFDYMFSNNAILRLFEVQFESLIKLNLSGQIYKS